MAVAEDMDVLDDSFSRDMLSFLVETGLLSGEEATSGLARLDVSIIGADGSSRTFARLRRDRRPLCLAVLPASREKRDLAEARSAWFIGRHLQRQGIPVPELYGWKRGTGLILFEDLGDTRLHEVVRETDFTDALSRQRLMGLYEETIEQLLAMQIGAAEGFVDEWCWDTPRYDRQVMLERESGYFLKAFWQDMLGCRIPEGIDEDFKAIANQAAQAPADFFLHRDFQSRNIMIKDGRIRIIDYQAGRRGPLAYDLASLLTDPYAALPGEFQADLLHYYLEKLGHRLVFATDDFLRQYSLFALQRNLQIIGAFAFLTKIRGKIFFADYIRPAVLMLNARLQDPLFSGRTVLQRTAVRAAEMLGY